MNDVNFANIDNSLFQSVGNQVAQRCDALSKCSDEPNSLKRTFCSDAMKAAHRQVRAWMESSSMTCRIDATSNLIGSHSAEPPGDGKNSPVFMIGSPLDTVVNAGRFDGSLGVLLGLGVVEVLRQSGIALPFDIDVVGFSEEEGVRFQFPFIGSLGLSGQFNPGDFARTDDDGVTIREALVGFGCDPDQLTADSYQRGERKLIGFLEAHLEQASHLEQTDAPVGVVSAIAGQTRASIVLEGVSGHAGTVPHHSRRDALAAAAKLILDIEQLGQETEGLFATVGAISALPGLSNVISNQVSLLLDLRHENDAVRRGAIKTIELMIRELKPTRSISGRIHRIEHSPAVPMDGALAEYLTAASQLAQGKSETLVSGAGHDAMVMAKFAPSCMLFVRCRDGISHHPDEFVAPQDICVALEVMTRAVIQFSNSFPKVA